MFNSSIACCPFEKQAKGIDLYRWEIYEYMLWQSESTYINMSFSPYNAIHHTMTTV